MATKRPPAHLSDEAKKLWRKICAEYDFSDQAGLLILQTAMEAFDRMRGAQAIVATEGATILDRFGQVKSHPILTAERDARAAMLAALKMLNLDSEEVEQPFARPGRPPGR